MTLLDVKAALLCFHYPTQQQLLSTMSIVLTARPCLLTVARLGTAAVLMELPPQVDHKGKAVPRMQVGPPAQEAGTHESQGIVYILPMEKKVYNIW